MKKPKIHISAGLTSSVNPVEVHKYQQERKKMKSTNPVSNSDSKPTEFKECVTVPVEPTEEMLLMGALQTEANAMLCKDVYKCMLSAAPQNPRDGELARLEYRVAELESEVKRLRGENERLSQRLPSTTMQTVCEIQQAQIEKLKAAVEKLGGDPLKAIGDKNG